MCMEICMQCTFVCKWKNGTVILKLTNVEIDQIKSPTFQMNIIYLYYRILNVNYNVDFGIMTLKSLPTQTFVTLMFLIKSF